MEYIGVFRYISGDVEVNRISRESLIASKIISSY